MNMALKIAVLRSGWEQRTIADKADVEETRFSKIVHGKAKVTPDEKKRIARALRMTVGELFAEDREAVSA